MSSFNEMHNFALLILHFLISSKLYCIHYLIRYPLNLFCIFMVFSHTICMGVLYFVTKYCIFALYCVHCAISSVLSKLPFSQLSHLKLCTYFCVAFYTLYLCIPCYQLYFTLLFVYIYIQVLKVYTDKGNSQINK